MNWKPAFILPGEDAPCTNAQVFATHAEALASAQCRYMVWTMPTDYLAVETNDPVNYRWTPEKGDEMIPEPVQLELPLEPQEG